MKNEGVSFLGAPFSFVDSAGSGDRRFGRFLEGASDGGGAVGVGLSASAGGFLGSGFPRLFWTASFEGEFSDAAFVQVPQSDVDHLAVLGERCCGEGEFEVLFFRKGEGDAAIFGCVLSTEEAGVVPVHHVFAVRHEDPAVCAGLRENLAEHGEIEVEGITQGEALSERSSVDVHDHVHQRFHLSCLTGSSDVTEEFALIGERFEHGADLGEGAFVAAAHEVQGAVPCLGDGGGHACLKAGRAGLLSECSDFDVGAWAHGCTVDECSTFGADQEVITLFGEDRELCDIVCHHGEDDFCKTRYIS